MEFGLFSFGGIGVDPRTGRTPTPRQVMLDLLEQIQLADELGLDWFGVGEHHRPDYAVSSYTAVLAAAAVRTKRIRLSTAVTVLSSDDPVRVFQNHASVDLLSDGRAEIMAGRGSFKESFALFGYDLKDYEELFAEKFELLRLLCTQERVSWSGKHRAALEDVTVYPRPVQMPLPLSLATGINPRLMRFAGGLGLPVSLAVMGFAPQTFVPMAELYREAAEEAGRERSELHLSLTCHFFAAETGELASDRFWPAYSAFDRQIAQERGFPPMNPRMYEHAQRKWSWLAVGGPEQLAEKIIFMHSVLSNDRWVGFTGMSGITQADSLRAIELFATEVVPRVREELGDSRANSDAQAAVSVA